jgi:Protein of unknown function (DUF3558)
MRNRFGSRTLSIAVAFLVAACGAGGGPAASTGATTRPAGGGSGTRAPAQQLTVDPCTLVTKDEAAAALGGSVTASSASPGGSPVCQYMAQPTPGTYTSLAVSDLGPATCDLMLIAVDKNLVSSGETILRDVGNVALIVNPGVIEVLVGSGCIEIDSSASAPLSDSVIIELAKKAVSRVH